MLEHLRRMCGALPDTPRGVRDRALLLLGFAAALRSAELVALVKQALKRRKPSFSENYHGFRSFGILLEEMRKRELLTLEHDPKSGGYLISSYSSD